MDFQPCLARAVGLAAEVDCLISLAQCAQDFSYCRPTLTQNNVLHIKQGVHALGQLIFLLQTFDTWMRKSSPHFIVA